mgnify:FL=1
MLEFIDGEFIDYENNIAVYEDDFIERFGTDWNFDTLYNHENVTPRWKEIFQSWKERGILN